jgi:CheY-like chemotaxis protein
MVLGETVHSFWFAVQIQEILLCNGWEAGELAVEHGIANTLPKEFPTGCQREPKIVHRTKSQRTKRLSTRTAWRRIEREFAMSHVISFPLEQSSSRMTTNLLLIDDNAVQAATRQTILRRAGYFVIAALNPARVLEQIQSGDLPEEIGLVITDHLMPGMSGADFVRALRRTHPKLPVLVISGLEEAEPEYASLDVTFRIKPLLPENLLEIVKELVGEGGSGSRLSAVS